MASFKTGERVFKLGGLAARLCACVLATIAFLSVPADALLLEQGTSAEAPFKGARLITLGTGGGPVPRKTRSQPATLLQVDDHLYLIDAGDGTARALTAYGFDPSQITQIFLTHLHYDHTAGLAPLLGFNILKNTRHPVEIHGPPGTQALLADAIRYLSIPIGVHAAQSPWIRQMAEVFSARETDAGGPILIYKDSGLSVTAVDNSHFSTIDPARRPVGAKRSFSYRFDTTDRSIVVTGDTGFSPAVTALAKGADILVAEVQDLDEVMAVVRAFPGPEKDKVDAEAHMRMEHMTPEEVGRMAAAAGVRQVVLTHLSTAEDAGLRSSAFAHRVRQVFKGVVEQARDGSEF